MTARPIGADHRYDSARRRRSVRKGRERGVWVYVPISELAAAGIDPYADPPDYLTRGYRRSRHGHSVVVSLYGEALPVEEAPAG